MIAVRFFRSQIVLLLFPDRLFHDETFHPSLRGYAAHTETFWTETGKHPPESTEAKSIKSWARCYVEHNGAVLPVLYNDGQFPDASWCAAETSVRSVLN